MRLTEVRQLERARLNSYDHCRIRRGIRDDREFLGRPTVLAGGGVTECDRRKIHTAENFVRQNCCRESASILAWCSFYGLACFSTVAVRGHGAKEAG